jgi:hypothetical protein
MAFPTTRTTIPQLTKSKQVQVKPTLIVTLGYGELLNHWSDVGDIGYYGNWHAISK